MGAAHTRWGNLFPQTPCDTAYRLWVGAAISLGKSYCGLGDRFMVKYLTNIFMLMPESEKMRRVLWVIIQLDRTRL